eukprot:219021-Chlamydomonas_euryale.AAC.5
MLARPSAARPRPAPRSMRGSCPLEQLPSMELLKNINHMLITHEALSSPVTPVTALSHLTVCAHPRVKPGRTQRQGAAQEHQPWHVPGRQDRHPRR